MFMLDFLISGHGQFKVVGDYPTLADRGHKLIMFGTISNLNGERRVCKVIYQKVVYLS